VEIPINSYPSERLDGKIASKGHGNFALPQASEHLQLTGIVDGKSRFEYLYLARAKRQSKGSQNRGQHSGAADIAQGVAVVV